MTWQATVDRDLRLLPEVRERHAAQEARRRARRSQALRRAAADISALLAAVAIILPEQLPGLTLAAVAACLLTCFLAGLYEPGPAPALAVQARTVVSVAAATGLLHALVASVIDDASTVPALHLWAAAALTLLAGRTIEHTYEQRRRRDGEGLRRTLILGAGDVGHRAARRLVRTPELGLRPIGFLDHDPRYATGVVPVLGAGEDLERVVREHDVDAVLVGFSAAPHADQLSAVRRAWDLGLEVLVVPRLFEVEGTRSSVEHVGGLPLVRIARGPVAGPWLRAKNLVERVVAATLLVLLAPVMLLVALAVLVTGGRPVLYRAERAGMEGRPFQMVKFRTLRGTPDDRGEMDSDWADAVEHEHEDPYAADALPQSDPDERPYTPIGHFLRRSSLDELPQLLCVVKGDMSLVGPRPERVRYVERFGAIVPRYTERHRVRPGITGWAQVNGLRGRTSLADRIEWDLFYVENWSPWLDLRILARTFSAVRRGARD